MQHKPQAHASWHDLDMISLFALHLSRIHFADKVKVLYNTLPRCFQKQYFSCLLGAFAGDKRGLITDL